MSKIIIIEREEFQSFVSDQDNLAMYLNNPEFHLVSNLLMGGVSKNGLLTIIKDLCKTNDDMRLKLIHMCNSRVDLIMKK